MAITRKAAKSKGRALEKTVVEAFRSAFPAVADGITQVAASCAGCDIVFDTKAKAAIPFDVECKARAKVGLIYDALGQAKRDPSRTPLAVIKADRKRPLAVIDLADFMTIVRAIPLP